MSPEHYKFLVALLQRECGLVLDDQKTYLAESQLAPVARQYGHEDIDKLMSNVMTMRSRDVVRAIVEAMVTNETYFFRDKSPFEHFEKQALPAMIEARGATKQLNIWSAAASIGQEAYSLAMILKKNAAKMTGWRNRIIGTDVSEQALERAKAAEYSQFEVQRRLPVKMLVDNFEQKGERWKVKADIRGAVRFDKFNLLDDPAVLGKFDIVFCRNVLIYFDVALRRKILDGIARQMNPGAYLYLGGSESPIGVSTAFTADKTGRGVYCLNREDRPAAAPAPGRWLAG